MSVSILLADDHPIVRQGLRALLEEQTNFRIVGEAGDGVAALRLVEQFKPDVLIVDVMMPSINGIEVVRQSKQRSPHTRAIILSMHPNEGYVVEALRNGATGYVLKDATFDHLVSAVNEVMAGRRYLSPPLSEPVMDAYLQRAQASALDPYETLTAREREVLHLAAEGRSNGEIAVALTIGVRTVETHRANLMRKLGLHSQTDLVRYAGKRGILKEM